MIGVAHRVFLSTNHDPSDELYRPLEYKWLFWVFDLTNINHESWTIYVLFSNEYRCFKLSLILRWALLPLHYMLSPNFETIVGSAWCGRPDLPPYSFCLGVPIFHACEAAARKSLVYYFNRSNEHTIELLYQDVTHDLGALATDPRPSADGFLFQ